MLWQVGSSVARVRQTIVRECWVTQGGLGQGQVLHKEDEVSIESSKKNAKNHTNSNPVGRPAHHSYSIPYLPGRTQFIFIAANTLGSCAVLGRNIANRDTD